MPTVSYQAPHLRANAIVMQVTANMLDDVIQHLMRTWSPDYSCVNCFRLGVMTVSNSVFGSCFSKTMFQTVIPWLRRNYPVSQLLWITQTSMNLILFSRGLDLFQGAASMAADSWISFVYVPSRSLARNALRPRGAHRCSSSMPQAAFACAFQCVRPISVSHFRISITSWSAFFVIYIPRQISCLRFNIHVTMETAKLDIVPVASGYTGRLPTLD